jgi:UDPglucose 6-dehydrogenase
MINNRISPIKYEYIEKFFKEKELSLHATTDTNVYKNVEYIIICTPTNYDTEKNYFDTSAVESVIDKAFESGTNATFIIKSTIPIGYCHKLYIKYGKQFNEVGKKFNLMFCPEFLCEGNALHDNLYPSRIIVGCPNELEFIDGEKVFSDDIKEKAKKFYELLKQGAISKEIPFLLIGLNEAESIKLFSNAYLAMRVCFFNELDTFAKSKNLNTKEIIDGVCLEPRIGNHYNNPSFGYGGYCLPKDTKQLLKNFENVPQNIISAIVNSNQTRKKHIVKMVTDKKPKTIGIYDSDNYRFSAIEGIVSELKKEANVIIYEPTSNEAKCFDCTVVNDFKEFEKNSDVILANRFDESLMECKDKVYTRDLFNRD